MRISDWSSDVCSSDLGAEYKSTYFRRRLLPEFHRDALCRLPSRVRLCLSDGQSGSRRPKACPSLRSSAPCSSHPSARPYACRCRWCRVPRSEEHTSELESLMRISYAVFCLKKKNKYKNNIRE